MGWNLAMSPEGRARRRNPVIAVRPFELGRETVLQGRCATLQFGGVGDFNKWQVVPAVRYAFREFNRCQLEASEWSTWEANQCYSV